MRSFSVIPGQVDLGASGPSAAIGLNQVFGAYVQAVFAGAPVGAAKLQVSADPGDDALGNQTGLGVVNWYDLPSTSQAVGAAGVLGWELDHTNYKWLRVVYTRTSGTGTMDVTVNCKGI